MVERRSFLKTAVGALAAGRVRANAEQRAALNEEATIADLAQISAREAAEFYLGRIREVDRGLRSVIELNPDALAMAEQLDHTPRRGPMHGVPVLIKDNIDTADRMQTTAGSLGLVGAARPRDAGVVERLRAAGAVILGETTRSRCGSSSGSGAGVAANLCMVAVGTETDGSVVCPASMNGIVGIKPTVGLVSGRGIIPIAHSQDTAGPMARTVRDAAILLGAMAEGPHAAPDYTKFLDANGLRGARLGVARKFFDISPDVTRLMENCLAQMKRLGAEIVDPADLPSHGKYDANENIVLQYEFKNDLNAYLQARGTGLTLEKLMAFNQEHRGDEMPWFEQEVFEESQKRGPLTELAYRKALATNHRLARGEGIDEVIRVHSVDAIVAPTAGPAWLIDPITGDHDTGGCSSPAAVAGYPHITVPAGDRQ